MSVPSFLYSGLDKETLQLANELDSLGGGDARVRHVELFPCIYCAIPRNEFQVIWPYEKVVGMRDVLAPRDAPVSQSMRYYPATQSILLENSMIEDNIPISPLKDQRQLYPAVSDFDVADPEALAGVSSIEAASNQMRKLDPQSSKLVEWVVDGFNSCVLSISTTSRTCDELKTAYIYGDTLREGRASVVGRPVSGLLYVTIDKLFERMHLKHRQPVSSSDAAPSMQESDPSVVGNFKIGISAWAILDDVANPIDLLAASTAVGSNMRRQTAGNAVSDSSSATATRSTHAARKGFTAIDCTDSSTACRVVNIARERLISYCTAHRQIKKQQQQQVLQRSKGSPHAEHASDRGATDSRTDFLARGHLFVRVLVYQLPKNQLLSTTNRVSPLRENESLNKNFEPERLASSTLSCIHFVDVVNFEPADSSSSATPFKASGGVGIGRGTGVVNQVHTATSEQYAHLREADRILLRKNNLQVHALFKVLREMREIANKASAARAAAPFFDKESLVSMTSARESKLTTVLAPILQGNTKTSIFAFLEDGERHALETQELLRALEGVTDILSACHRVKNVPLSALQLTDQNTVFGPEYTTNLSTSPLFGGSLGHNGAKPRTQRQQSHDKYRYLDSDSHSHSAEDAAQRNREEELEDAAEQERSGIEIERGTRAGGRSEGEIFDEYSHVDLEKLADASRSPRATVAHLSPTLGYTPSSYTPTSTLTSRSEQVRREGNKSNQMEIIGVRDVLYPQQGSDQTIAGPDFATGLGFSSQNLVFSTHKIENQQLLQGQKEEGQRRQGGSEVNRVMDEFHDLMEEIQNSELHVSDHSTAASSSPALHFQNGRVSGEEEDGTGGEGEGEHGGEVSELPAAAVGHTMDNLPLGRSKSLVEEFVSASRQAPQASQASHSQLHRAAVSHSWNLTSSAVPAAAPAASAEGVSLSSFGGILAQSTGWTAGDGGVSGGGGVKRVEGAERDKRVHWNGDNEIEREENISPERFDLAHASADREMQASGGRESGKRDKNAEELRAAEANFWSTHTRQIPQAHENKSRGDSSGKVDTLNQFQKSWNESKFDDIGLPAPQFSSFDPVSATQAALFASREDQAGREDTTAAESTAALNDESSYAAVFHREFKRSAAAISRASGSWSIPAEDRSVANTALHGAEGSTIGVANDSAPSVFSLRMQRPERMTADNDNIERENQKEKESGRQEGEAGRNMSEHTAEGYLGDASSVNSASGFRDQSQLSSTLPNTHAQTPHSQPSSHPRDVGIINTNSSDCSNSSSNSGSNTGGGENKSVIERGREGREGGAIDNRGSFGLPPPWARDFAPLDQAGYDPAIPHHIISPQTSPANPPLLLPPPPPPLPSEPQRNLQLHTFQRDANNRPDTEMSTSTNNNSSYNYIRPSMSNAAGLTSNYTSSIIQAYRPARADGHTNTMINTSHVRNPGHSGLYSQREEPGSMVGSADTLKTASMQLHDTSSSGGGSGGVRGKSSVGALSLEGVQEVERLQRTNQALMETVREERADRQRMQQAIDAHADELLEMRTQCDLEIEKSKGEARQLKAQLRALCDNSSLTDVYKTFEENITRLLRENENLRTLNLELESRELNLAERSVQFGLEVSAKKPLKRPSRASSPMSSSGQAASRGVGGGISSGGNVVRNERGENAGEDRGKGVVGKYNRVTGRLQTTQGTVNTSTEDRIADEEKENNNNNNNNNTNNIHSNGSHALDSAAHAQMLLKTARKENLRLLGRLKLSGQEKESMRVELEEYRRKERQFLVGSKMTQDSSRRLKQTTYELSRVKQQLERLLLVHNDTARDLSLIKEDTQGMRAAELLLREERARLLSELAVLRDRVRDFDIERQRMVKLDKFVIKHTSRPSSSSAGAFSSSGRHGVFVGGSRGDVKSEGTGRRTGGGAGVSQHDETLVKDLIFNNIHPDASCSSSARSPTRSYQAIRATHTDSTTNNNSSTDGRSGGGGVGAVQSVAGLASAQYIRPEELSHPLTEALEASLSALHEAIIAHCPTLLPLYRRLAEDLHNERTHSLEQRARLVGLIYPKQPLFGDTKSPKQKKTGDTDRQYVSSSSVSGPSAAATVAVDYGQDRPSDGSKENGARALAQRQQLRQKQQGEETSSRAPNSTASPVPSTPAAPNYFRSAGASAGTTREQRASIHGAARAGVASRKQKEGKNDTTASMSIFDRDPHAEKQRAYDQLVERHRVEIAALRSADSRYPSSNSPFPSSTAAAATAAVVVNTKKGRATTPLSPSAGRRRDTDERPVLSSTSTTPLPTPFSTPFYSSASSSLHGTSSAINQHRIEEEVPGRRDDAATGGYTESVQRQLGRRQGSSYPGHNWARTLHADASATSVQSSGVTDSGIVNNESAKSVEYSERHSQQSGDTARMRAVINPEREQGYSSFEASNGSGSSGMADLTMPPRSYAATFAALSQQAHANDTHADAQSIVQQQASFTLLPHNRSHTLFQQSQPSTSSSFSAAAVADSVSSSRGRERDAVRVRRRGESDRAWSRSISPPRTAAAVAAERTVHSTGIGGATQNFTSFPTIFSDAVKFSKGERRGAENESRERSERGYLPAYLTERGNGGSLLTDPGSFVEGMGEGSNNMNNNSNNSNNSNRDETTDPYEIGSAHLLFSSDGVRTSIDGDFLGRVQRIDPTSAPQAAAPPLAHAPARAATAAVEDVLDDDEDANELLDEYHKNRSASSVNRCDLVDSYSTIPTAMSAGASGFGSSTYSAESRSRRTNKSVHF